MQTCTKCGRENVPGTSFCNKCGAGLGQQLRAVGDARRINAGKYIRVGSWIAAIILVLAASPFVYRLGGTAYYRYRLSVATDGAVLDCGGPVTTATEPYLKTQIEACLAKNKTLRQAQQDYDDFTHPAKR